MQAKENVMLFKKRKQIPYVEKYTDILHFSLRRWLKLLFSIQGGGMFDYPRQFWIEITSKCNLHCVMCPVSKGLLRKTMTMDMDAFMQIIDQIYMVQPCILLHVAGEPLLNKNAMQMIEYAKKKGCWVGMHTNGTLFTKEMSMRVLESPLDWICFSFDGATQELYEKIRVGAKFEKVKAQIEYFFYLRDKKKSKKPLTRIEILLMDDTARHISEFVKYWQAQKVDSIGIRQAGDWIGLVEPVWSRSKERKIFGHKPCKDVFIKCAILVDGTIVPCCNDIEGRLQLGNIFKEPFDEIWNGDN